MSRHPLARKIVLRLAAVIIGILIALVLAEVTVRILKIEDSVQVIQKTRLGEHILGADPVGRARRFKISSDADLVYELNNPPTVPREKPSDELRVLCLGDSVTDNDWQRERTTFPGILKRLLPAWLEAPYRRCRIINSAITGYNAVQSHVWYKKQWLNHKFDFVIFAYCCLNDRTEIRYINEIDGQLYCATGREYVPCIFQFPGQQYLLRFSALYRVLNTKLAPWFEGRGKKVGEYTQDLTSPTRSAVLELKNLSEKSGAHFILVIFPALQEEEREHKWILDLARSQGIHYIDLKPVFEKAGYDQLRIKSKDQWDNVHPNQTGHNVVAGVLAREILQKEVELVPAELYPACLNGNLLASEKVVVNALSRNQPHEGVDKLHDGNTATYWHISLDQIDLPTWVTADFGAGNEKIVRSLFAHPRENMPQQFFRNAELFSSTDGVNWTSVAPIVQDRIPDDSQWARWSFENERPYRYYKLVIYDGYENGSAHHFHSLAELAMFE